MPGSPSVQTHTTDILEQSDSSSNLFTPNFTPSGTPHNGTTAVRLDLKSLSDTARMDTSKTEGRENKEEVRPPLAEGSSSTKAEVRAQDASEKAICKKHPKTKKSSKKRSSKREISSSSGSSSDSSSSSSEDESTEDESTSSDESEDEAAKKKRKSKARRRAKKLKEKRKAWSKKQKELSSESSEEDSSDESSSDDEKSKKARKFKKRKAKKAKKAAKTSDGYMEENDSPMARARAQLNALGLRGMGGRRARDGGTLVTDRDAALKKALSGKLPGKSKSGKKTRASKVAFKRVDQLWDSSIHNYKLTETVDDPDTDEYNCYIFTVRRKFDWENKYTDTVVDIKSKLLKQALNHVMDGVKGVSLVEDIPVVDPNMLFLYLEELRAYMKELRVLRKTKAKKKLRKAADLKASHVKGKSSLLIKYLDKDYSQTKKTLYPLLENRTITFDLLWALFKPNTLTHTTTYGNLEEPRAFKMELATKESSFMKGQWYCIEGRYLEYDGKVFGMGTIEVDIEAFKGPRPITSLTCYPLEYHENPEGTKEKLVERGKKFVALKGMNYRFHKGMGFYKKKRGIVKVNINGRIMVDPCLHRRINPNYQISPVRPKDPDILSDGGDSDDNSCCCDGNSSDEEGQEMGVALEEDDPPKTKFKVVKDKKERVHLVEVELDENGNEIYKEKMDQLSEVEEEPTERIFTEEELLIASPVVLGFAFSEKLWLEFTVSGVKDIEWNVGAFDSLVLPDNQKSIVKALVESHTFSSSRNIDDIIQGKGRGLVAILHGPPGTGKTLTAEGIAELLRCPLYMVSAGELGTNPRELEAELNKILDIAHSWSAIILLDEADVFLEKRTIQDIHRNALVSVFLRLLEYFQGILFLTTNRIETFDDAFQSRIHVALRYAELDPKARRSVWKLFLGKVQEKDGVETEDFKESDFDTLSRHNLNGRQIKNTVRTAQALAVNEKKPLNMEHLNRVLQVGEAFSQDLRGGTGYMDAMRSYT